MKHTTIRPAPGSAPQDYCNEVTVVRVYRLEDGSFDPREWGDDVPWQIDGYNESTGAYTEAVENYPTHAQALAGAETFIERNGYERKERP